MAWATVPLRPLLMTSSFASPLGNRAARVLFVTQGYLAQVMGDGTLRGAAVLVLDETQSRRIELSFLYAMLKLELARRGDSFRLVLMSAEDEEGVMRDHFGSDLGAVKVSGRRLW